MPVLDSGTNSPLSGATAIAGGTLGPHDVSAGIILSNGNGYVLKADKTPTKIFLGLTGTGTSQSRARLFSGDMVGAGLTNNNIIQIAAGNAHFLALRFDGKVLAAGVNGSGQLGNGSTINADFIADCRNRLCFPDATPVHYTNDPVVVTGLTSVTAVAAKANRSFALLADGTVWTWGDGILTPVQVQNLDNVRTIGPGYAIKNDCSGPGGTLWAILFPSGAQPTAERVPLVGDLSACTVPSFNLGLLTETLDLMATSDQQVASVFLIRTGYTDDVDLQVLDCPIGVECTASPDPIPGNENQAIVTFQTTNATPENYVVAIRGIGGGTIREAFLELRIQSEGPR